MHKVTVLLFLVVVLLLVLIFGWEQYLEGHPDVNPVTNEEYPQELGALD